jgi:hypothetical protein
MVQCCQLNQQKTIKTDFSKYSYPISSLRVLSYYILINKRKKLWQKQKQIIHQHIQNN